MGPRALTELFHLLVGVVLTATLFEAAVWAYPIGAGTILAVGWITIAAVTAMAVGPLARAWQLDRNARHASTSGVSNARPR